MGFKILRSQYVYDKLPSHSGLLIIAFLINIQIKDGLK